jgi:lipoprotein-anchoring transpeptidase ErfK/SrfK
MKRTLERWRLALLLTIVPGAGMLLWSQVDLAPPTDPPMRLVVSLSARTLKVVENGEVVRTYGVAIGRPRYPTPTGSFRTGTIDWNPRWTPPPSDWARGLKRREAGDPRNPIQGVKIYFRAPYYPIHGTNDPGSIGYAESHGCIRMETSDAVALANSIEEAGGTVPLRIVD